MLNSSHLYSLFLRLNTAHMHSFRILRDLTNKLFQDIFLDE